MIRQSTGNKLDSILYDWQESHADALVDSINRNGVAKDGSDTGTGKTVIALEVAKRTNLKPFVVCPKSVIPAWVEWMEKGGHDREHVVNYEKLRGGKTDWGWIPKRGFFRWKTLDPKDTLIIFDEDHRMKGTKSLNSKMLISAKALGFKILLLGATSCANPLEMRAMGYALDMHDSKDWWNWCLRNGCKKGRFSLEFSNPGPTLKKFHKHIYEGYGSRIRISDLPEGTFPDNLIIPDGYRLDDDIDSIYHTMASELESLQNKVEQDEEENPLTIQLRARQEVELLKVPTFVELAKDAYAEGSSVAIFVNFKGTLEAIAQRLMTLCTLAVLEGGQTREFRDLQIQDFRADRARIIICMIQAGGVGISLHDTHGNHPRVSLISPGFSAVELKQTLGRIHRSGSKTPAVQKIIFAAGSVEMRVCALVKKKLKHLDLVNDDDLNPIFV
jgi:SNF2 family DNA or RNA helicase